MLNKNFSFKTLVMTLVFGLLSVWSLSAQTDNRLNGKWFGASESNDGTEWELTLNNGNYESSANGGIPYDKGTYTTNNGEITLKPTHIFGGGVNSVFDYPILESKWYTINVFVIAFRTFFLEDGAPEEDEEDINDVINFIISLSPYLYYVDANMLTLTTELEGEPFTRTYTRR
ncbi:MAG: hypothetical protein LBI28_07435 [Treponema sp.]|jgi:hypothetical protein|nr:hypothetical protein [Treponema sp.]